MLHKGSPSRQSPKSPLQKQSVLSGAQIDKKSIADKSVADKSDLSAPTRRSPSIFKDKRSDSVNRLDQENTNLKQELAQLISTME